MALTEDQIRIAIGATTGRGNILPNPHRVRSWLSGQGLDLGGPEDYDQIQEFLKKYYGMTPLPPTKEDRMRGV